MEAFLNAAFSLVIPGTLLYTAIRFHRSTNRNTTVMKIIGVVLAFVAGVSMLATFVSQWLAMLIDPIPFSGIGLLLAALATLIVDVVVDKRPDSLAFWAAFILPFAIVVGWADQDEVFSEIDDGASRITRTVTN